VRDELLSEGVLERGRGKGGSIRRAIIENGEKNASNLSGSRPTEAKLYEPLMRTLKDAWVRDMSIDPEQIFFEMTAKQGAKQTGGKWSRPDITAVSIRSFAYLPTKFLDVWTFEVKSAEWLDVTAVFEAAAHGGRATRSYALLQVPEQEDQRTKEILDRCEREAARLNVGLITFSDPETFTTWETRVDAPRLDTAPEYLQEFINHLSDEAKNKLLRWK
jgi:hypothetical protein